MARPTTTGSRSQRKLSCECGHVAYMTPANLRDCGPDPCGRCYRTSGAIRFMDCSTHDDYLMTPQGLGELEAVYAAKAAKAGDRELLNARRAKYRQLRCVKCQHPQTTEQSIFILEAYERENQCAYDGDVIRVRGEGERGYRFSDGSSRYCGCEKCGGDTLRPIHRPATRQRVAKAATLAETASCPF